MGHPLHEWMYARHSDHKFFSKEISRILAQMCFWLCNFHLYKMGFGYLIASYLKYWNSTVTLTNRYIGEILKPKKKMH